MYSNGLPFTLLVWVLSLRFIAAVPTWEGMNGRSSIGSLIPGSSYIEAMGITHPGYTNYLTVHEPVLAHIVNEIGQIANLSVMPSSSHRAAPPLFYINQNQLWLLVNETTVYPVNIHNSTGIHELPMQLILGKKRAGITNGIWRWKATQLYYDLPGGKSNQGLYFHCILDSGLFNVFMSIIPAPPPNGCRIMTLHSFIRSSK